MGKVTRRLFLKIAAAVAAVGALGKFGKYSLDKHTEPREEGKMIAPGSVPTVFGFSYTFISGSLESR